MSATATWRDVVEGRARWCVVEGDALAVLPGMPHDLAAAVVTDPPYGIGYTTGFSPSCSWHNRPIAGDETTGPRDAAVAWAESRRLPWACFGTWKVPPPTAARGALVWDKGPAFGMGDLSFPWKPSWELIFVGGPGWRGKRDEGVLHGPCVVSWESKGRVHPTQKPTWLIASLLSKLADRFIVLDPFCGSGAVGIACCERGRRFIGVDLDAGTAALARKRLAAVDAACPLFEPARQGGLFDAAGLPPPPAAGDNGPR